MTSKKVCNSVTEGSCVECKEYFGTPEKDNKCTYCYTGKVGLYNKGLKNDQFCEELEKFVESNLVEKKIQNMLEKACKADSYGIMLHLHSVMTKNKKYISAEFANDIINKYGRNERKSHIICSLIIDWWNMKDKNFNGTEMCYYGHFGDPYEIQERVNSIPPQLNNYFGIGSIEKFVMDKTVSVSSNSKPKLTKAERRRALKTRK